MEENQDYEVENEYDEDEEVISISDRMIGVLTEPANLFTRLAQGQTKVLDWLLPLILVIMAAILIQVVVMITPTLKHQAMEKQVEATKVYFDKAVEDGQMTQDQADQQLDAVRDRMSEQMGAQVIIQIVAVVIMSFLFFFIISSFFILISKFVLKGEGTYSEGLSAMGLAAYITVLQLVITVIIIMVTDSVDMGPNLGKLLGMDIKAADGYFLSFINPFSLWYYYVLAVGLSKIFKSDSIGKYLGLTFGSWIIWGVIFFYLSESFPMLKSFIQ